MTHTKEHSWILFLVIIRCLWFPLLSTLSLILTIILPSSWSVAIHSARYLKSSSFLWPSRKNVSEFDNPVDILINHFLALWDQHVYNNSSIQNGRIHFGQVALVPISKQLGLQILCLTEQCWRKGCSLRFEELVQIFTLDLTCYIKYREEAVVFCKCNQFLRVIRFFHLLFDIAWQCNTISWICDINMPFNT